MNTVATFTIAALTALVLNGAAFAGKVHTLDDIHEAEQKALRAADLERNLEQTDPILLRKIKKEQKKAAKNTQFPGRGHKLGGDKYVNRLLGVDHKEGKRLYKLSKKVKKSSKNKSFHHNIAHKSMIRTPLSLAMFTRGMIAPAA